MLSLCSVQVPRSHSTKEWYLVPPVFYDLLYKFLDWLQLFLKIQVVIIGSFYFFFNPAPPGLESPSGSVTLGSAPLLDSDARPSLLPPGPGPVSPRGMDTELSAGVGGRSPIRPRRGAGPPTGTRGPQEEGEGKEGSPTGARGEGPGKGRGSQWWVVRRVDGWGPRGLSNVSNTRGGRED